MVLTMFTKKKLLIARVSDRLHAQYTAEAARLGQDVSEVVRRALQAYFSAGDPTARRVEDIERKVDALLTLSQEGSVVGRREDLRIYMDIVAKGNLEAEMRILDSQERVITRLDAIREAYKNMAAVIKDKLGR